MWVKPVVLQGRHLRLEPLTADHAPLWARHHEPELFAYMSRGAPQGGDAAGYAEYIEYLNAEPGRMNWAIRVGEDFAGRISYVGITPAHRKLEIGTFIVKPYHGTFVNPESKYLMLRHAFEDLGAVRVQFTVDVRNERSQRAMEKLGAVREGVLRKAAITPDGFIRDSVVYSITDDDWPRVRVGLEERLGYGVDRR